MATLTMTKVVRAELAAREQLANDIVDIILSKEYTYGTGKGEDGYVLRGEVQNYAYHALGFHGWCSNEFAKFVNRAMVNRGFRLGHYRGREVYYGVKKRHLLSLLIQP